MAGRSPVIGVIGGGACSRQDYAAAVEVGRWIAQRGGVVICGGLGGVMEAACKGAAEAGGLTVGILPGSDPGEANPYVQIPIATGMGIGRNILIVRTAAALIAVDGRYGTLSEIAYALQLGKPVFGLNSWNDIPGVVAVADPEEAVERAFQAARG